MPQTRKPAAEWVAIQANPKAGSGAQREQVGLLVDSLREQGLRPLLFKNRDRLSHVLTNPELKSRLRCIVAAGGDGTVGDVLHRYPGCPISILPLGTENLLARYLGIPRCGRSVGEIIAAGHVRTVDLASVGDRRFSLMASIGFDAEVVHRLDAIRTGHVRRASYLKPIWDSLRSYQYPDLRIRLDDDPQTYTAKLVMVVNINAYALGIQPAQSARDDDGLLEVLLFERGSTFQMLRYFYKVMRGTHESLVDIRRLRASRIHVESDGAVPVQIDGDPAGTTPVDIRVLPAAAQFVAPASRVKVTT
ncbi:Diacylglycerol kinase [Symmachiella dynata]|uniref:Diacylglycerol kinase n=1 Tax=Symmachiella dynata TaxID=2527995 RepID=A0A517ZH33_9PLAN|nr:diacylglycerol kinase family protein [Symmachiella dynata]QDU41759.1 Diacylglycerol kinase [Symmachiella dynata]